MIIFKINILLIFLTKLIVYLYFFTLMLALSVFFSFFVTPQIMALRRNVEKKTARNHPHYRGVFQRAVCV